MTLKLKKNNSLRDRYLSHDPKKKTYIMRITVFRDPTLKGKRIKQYLKTEDIEEARAKRDLIHSVLEKAEVLG